VKLGIDTKDRFIFGIGLHPFQDSWSHENFSAFISGHLSEGHKPDDPSMGYSADLKKIGKAGNMAKATYDAMVEFQEKAYGIKPALKLWEDIEGKINTVFASGVPMQDTDHAVQVAFRIRTWVSLIKKDFGVDASYEYVPNTDPWHPEFGRALRELDRN
jgi:hypothetical protein